MTELPAVFFSSVPVRYWSYSAVGFDDMFGRAVVFHGSLGSFSQWCVLWKIALPELWVVRVFQKLWSSGWCVILVRIMVSHIAVWVLVMLYESPRR